MIDFYAGTMHNETSDETYIATYGPRILFDNPSLYFCSIMDSINKNSCFYFVFYTGDPSWHYKSRRSNALCFLYHTGETHKSIFPKYIPYNYDTLVFAYIYRPSNRGFCFKMIVHATDLLNNSMDSYISGGLLSSGFSLIPKRNIISFENSNNYLVMFALRWVGPLNIKYLTFSITSPLYTTSEYMSNPISIVSYPNTIHTLLNYELDIIYLYERISIPATAMFHSNPVNNIQLRLFVEDYSSPTSYGVNNPIFAIYMILLGEDRLFDYISSPNCVLNSATTFKYTDSSGSSLFMPYFEEGKPGKYTIYIRFNSLFTEAKSIILKNKISKVILQSNINQTINVPFIKLNNIIYPYTVVLHQSHLLGINDENGIPIKDKQRNIKAYIFTIDEINMASANKNIAKSKLTIADFQTSLYSLNSTYQHLKFLLQVITNQINTQRMFYTQIETYNVSITNTTFNGSHYLLNNLSITFENEGEYCIIFSVDGIESELSDSLIIKSKSSKTTIMRSLQNVSLLMIIGLFIISNIILAKYAMILAIALIVIFGYSIKNEAAEYYSFYYAIIVILSSFSFYFVVQLFKKSILTDPNSMDISYRSYVISKLNVNGSLVSEDLLHINLIKSNPRSISNCISKTKKAFKYIYKLLTPNYKVNLNENNIIYPTKILLGAVLALFAIAFILIKLINFYLVSSQKYIQ